MIEEIKKEGLLEMGEKRKEISCEELHKEIDLIQDCVKRMSNNSFLLKGWLISILVVIIALSPDEVSRITLILLSLVITMSFWRLDAFFLRTEKLYRKMYEWVLEKRKRGNIEYQYDLNPHRFDKEVDNLMRIMFSDTLRWFYGSIAFLIVVALVYYIGPNILKSIL